MKILIYILFFKVASTQINGDFWWLNNKITELKGLNVNDLAYKEESDFDKDESDKIVFFDDYVPNRVANTVKYFTKNDEIKIGSFKVTDDFKRPTEVDNFVNIDNSNPTKIVKNGIVSDVEFGRLSMTNKNGEAIFPDNRIVFRASTEKTPRYKICNYLTKTDCIRRDGFIFLGKLQEPNSKITLTDSFVCCIAPLSQKAKRFRRSKDEVDVKAALKQRKILILRRHNSYNRTNPAPTSNQRFEQTVTTEDDYIDPYWNIKNINIQKPNTGTHNKYINQDYEEGYLAEIPRPLIGSDQPSTDWSIYKGSNDYSDNTDYDEVEEEQSFGYGKVDPRRTDENLAKRRKPSKPTPTSKHLGIVDNPTIIYHSNPDFKVLQGFKLLFLVPNVTRNGIIEKLSTERGKEIDRRNIVIQPPESETFSYKDQKHVHKINHANHKDERKTATSAEISSYNK